MYAYSGIGLEIINIHAILSLVRFFLFSSLSVPLTASLLAHLFIIFLFLVKYSYCASRLSDCSLLYIALWVLRVELHQIEYHQLEFFHDSHLTWLSSLIPRS